MLKTKLVSAVLLSLLAGTSMAQSATPEALPSQAWLQDASGNPYCDGMTSITKNGAGWSAVYDATTYCGQFSAYAGGPNARGMKPTSALKAGAALTIETYPYYGITVTVALNTDGTWGVYDTFGNLYNSGLWSTSPPALRPNGARPASALAR